jgi:hypothetical protein
MKKTLLAFAIFLMSVSSSFAYQIYSQGMSASGFYNGQSITAYNYMAVNVNTNCDWVTFSGWVSTNSYDDTAASFQAWESQNGLIGEWNYRQGDPNSNFSYTNNSPNLYWGTINAVMSATHCYAEALLQWAYN